MGVHCGLASPRDDDYVAFAVHQAARVVNAAHGGQIVVSADAAAAAAPASSLSLVSLGHYRVRDFDEPVELYQIVGADIPVAFPPLRVIPADGHNIVAPRTSLVGRDVDLATLADHVGIGAPRQRRRTGWSWQDASRD